MNNIQLLWKERVQQYFIELRKYLKYMLNDHFLFVLIFGLGAGLYYYSDWVKTLDKDFPAAWIAAIILSLFLALGSVYTFLKRADTVFLIPLEEKMQDYFKKSLTTSLAFQSYPLILVMAAFMPMLAQVNHADLSSFFIWLLIIIGLKFWNLTVRWHILKYQEKEAHLIDIAVRYFLNVILLYFLFSKANLYLVIALLVMMIAYLSYFKKVTNSFVLKWETLVELEERRMSRFYHLANLFTDVPHLEGKVKRRVWMDFILQTIPFKQENSFTYLLSRTFIRLNEYFGLFVRLTVIGGLIIAFSDILVLKLILSFLFIYLTGFQLFPMMKRHESKIWVFLYPVPQEQKKKAFLYVLRKWLLIQSVLFGILAGLPDTWKDGLIVIICNLVFASIFIILYAPARLKKMERKM